MLWDRRGEKIALMEKNITLETTRRDTINHIRTLNIQSIKNEFLLIIYKLYKAEPEHSQTHKISDGNRKYTNGEI